MSNAQAAGDPDANASTSATPDSHVIFCRLLGRPRIEVISTVCGSVARAASQPWLATIQGLRW
jgi:hypothetical protein